MSEKGKEEGGGWEEFGEDYGRDTEEPPIPKGREMTVEEEQRFLAALLAGSINANTARISGSRMD